MNRITTVVFQVLHIPATSSSRLKHLLHKITIVVIFFITFSVRLPEFVLPLDFVSAKFTNLVLHRWLGLVAVPTSGRILRSSRGRPRFYPTVRSARLLLRSS